MRANRLPLSIRRGFPEHVVKKGHLSSLSREASEAGESGETSDALTIPVTPHTMDTDTNMERRHP